MVICCLGNKQENHAYKNSNNPLQANIVLTMKHDTGFLKLGMLWADLADDTDIFLIFSRKTGFYM